jgi:hypothetical protein
MPPSQLRQASLPAGRCIYVIIRAAAAPAAAASGDGGGAGTLSHGHVGKACWVLHPSALWLAALGNAAATACAALCFCACSVMNEAPAIVQSCQCCCIHPDAWILQAQCMHSCSSNVSLQTCWLADSAAAAGAATYSHLYHLLPNLSPALHTRESGPILLPFTIHPVKRCLSIRAGAAHLQARCQVLAPSSAAAAAGAPAGLLTQQQRLTWHQSCWQTLTASL